MTTKEKLNNNRKGGKATLAANFYNFETLIAVLEAAQAAHSDVILQSSPSTLKYLGVETAAKMANSAKKNYDINAWLHLDHGNSIDIVTSCLNEGYDSVMIDASEKEVEENIEITGKVVQLSQKYGAQVEAELGYIAKLGQDQTAKATDAEEANYFAESTGIDSLAVAIGNAHGFYKETPKLQFDALRAISEKLSIPLVLHGSSGIPDHDIQKAIQLGICKINLATEIKNAFMKKLRDELTQNDEIDLRKIFPKATKEASQLIFNKLKVINEA